MTSLDRAADFTSILHLSALITYTWENQPSFLIEFGEDLSLSYEQLK